MMHSPNNDLSFRKKTNKVVEKGGNPVCRVFFSVLVSMRYSFPKQPICFMCLQYNVFENTLGKRRNCNSLFPNVLFTGLENFLPFPSNLKLSSANLFDLEESKICHLAKG